MFIVRVVIIFLFFVLVSNQSPAKPWHLIGKWATGLSKNVPRQTNQLLPPPGSLNSADEGLTLSPPLRNALNSADEGLGLSGRLIRVSLAKARHSMTCPLMNLRVSLPQLNTSISVPSGLNIRKGPGTKHQIIASIGKKARIWTVDLLRTDACWVQVRWGQNNTGWIYAKLLEFTFDNHLTKPQARLIRNLGSDGVYKLVSRSTYKIKTPLAQGTAVATSPTILLTNCHVLGAYDEVQIIENGRGYKAILIHDDYSKDKCFIRSLELEVWPVANIKSFAKILQREPAYSIGAPLGLNRSLGKGAVVAVRKKASTKWVYATAPVEPGSSGGGLFDTKGNLMGITTLKTWQGYSWSIAAEDFWK